MGLEIWHVWIIVAIILFIAEIFTPGFLLACFGGGCLAAALVAFLDMEFIYQIMAFAIVTLLFFLGIRPFFIKYFYSEKDQIKTNVDALIGKTCHVSELINPILRQGRVIVGGEDWKAISDDETIIEVGQKVVVIRVEGAKLYVRLRPESIGGIEK